MKEERVEILKMLHEGIISVEEAEKLLSALNSGEDKAKSETNYKKYNHQSQEYDFFGTGFLKDLDKGLSGIGKVVEGVFGNLSKIHPYKKEDESYKDYESVSIIDGIISTNPGDHVYIQQRINPGYSGTCDLEINSESIQEVIIQSDIDHSIDIKRKDNNLLIICYDECSITLPHHIEELSIKLINGDMEIHDIQCPLICETLNGDISIENCSQPRFIKSLSGDLEMNTNSAYSGKCESSTLSGDLRISIPGTFSGIIDAKAMSGEINCNLDRETIIKKESGVLQESQRIEVRDGDSGNHIICSTLSGDIEIESQ